MTLLDGLQLDGLTPSRLWKELDAETRKDAAGAMYESNDGSGATQADAAVAAAIRFRPVALQRLPLEKRVHYLLRHVTPDDSLASMLLLSLHLERRSALLEVFLDHLEIPQTNGAIDEDHELEPVEPLRLSAAVDRIYDKFPGDTVDVYLATLLAMDPDTWQGLTEVIAKRCQA